MGFGRQRLDEAKAYVVSRLGVGGAGIAETDDDPQRYFFFSAFGSFPLSSFPSFFSSLASGATPAAAGFAPALPTGAAAAASSSAPSSSFFPITSGSAGPAPTGVAANNASSFASEIGATMLTTIISGSSRMR